MTKPKRNSWISAIACAVVLGGGLGAHAQTAPSSPTAPVPPSMANPLPVAPQLLSAGATGAPAVSTPSSSVPVVPAAYPIGAPGPANYPGMPPAYPNSLPQVGPGIGYPPAAQMSPGGTFPIQIQPTMPMTAVPGQSSQLSSQPVPFQVTPDTPAPGAGDPRFFDGFKSYQDAFSELLSGKFKDTRYKWYGFIRLDGIYDFHPMASTDSFVTSAIPVPQERGQNAVLTPRYTRIGFDTETPLKSLDWDLKTRIELDFFNGNTSGAFGSFPLRLRFAWADFGPFLIGQAASLFMDYDVYPNILDYEGPGGMVLMRQPIFAVRCPIGDKLTISAGIEQPYSDIQWFENGAWVVNPGSGIITTQGVGRNVQDVPDFTANVKYTGDYGHVQVAGIVRKLTFQPATGTSAFDDVGYGINLTGSFHPWACFTGTPKSGDDSTALSRSRFLGQFAAGRGISRYIQDVNGMGLDATYDPLNGFRTIPSYGWFASYEQWWCKKWASVFTYGQDSFDLTDTLPGTTYQRANYFSTNLIWLPVERMGVGIEYLYGFRKDKDGERGENSRIQMAFQYRF
jgi:DcaP outer membrane protein